MAAFLVLTLLLTVASVSLGNRVAEDVSPSTEDYKASEDFTAAADVQQTTGIVRSVQVGTPRLLPHTPH